MDSQAIFAALRPLFARHAASCVVLHDEPHRYYLGTHEIRAKDGYRTWFGGVEIKKNYVSAHLIPVYAHPDLAQGISAPLKQRMQGKSCFNFKSIDPALFAELDNLIQTGVARFKADGRIHTIAKKL